VSTLFLLPAKFKADVLLDFHQSVTSTFSSSNDLQDSPSRESFMEWFFRKLTRRDKASKEHPRSHLADPTAATHDVAETLKWYQRSAEKGDAWAQLRLGHAYQQGNGVEQDEAQALKWYRRAAAQGQYNLGVRYAQGLGVARDYGQTVRWYKLAAHHGHTRAQVNLGSMYCKGYGVAQDQAEAVKWYRLAAEQGDAIAQYNLAVSYLKGQGVAQDCLKAHLWFSLSAEGGDQQAAISRDKLTAKMAALPMNHAHQSCELPVTDQTVPAGWTNA